MKCNTATQEKVQRAEKFDDFKLDGYNKDCLNLLLIEKILEVIARESLPDVERRETDPLTGIQLCVFEEIDQARKYFLRFNAAVA